MHNNETTCTCITTGLTSRHTVKYYLNDGSLSVTKLDKFSPHYLGATKIEGSTGVITIYLKIVL